MEVSFIPFSLSVIGFTGDGKEGFFLALGLGFYSVCINFGEGST